MKVVVWSWSTFFVIRSIRWHVAVVGVSAKLYIGACATAVPTSPLPTTLQVVRAIATAEGNLRQNVTKRLVGRSVQDIFLTQRASYYISVEVYSTALLLAAQ